MTVFEDNLPLFEQDKHRNILLRTFDVGPEVPCNQHLIIDHDEAILLDPGGHKLYSKVFKATQKTLGKAKLKYLFLSHQDPDVVAATNGWLMALPEMQAFCSKLWHRFVAHIGPDRLLFDRMQGIEDEGCIVPLGKSELWVLPAHFLHSSGNFHIYDPKSKILYTGDLGASLGEEYRTVTNFAEHIQYMEGFHQRYMASTKALKNWLNLVRPLEIETVAPQHGALMRGDDVTRFFDWLEQLEVGADRLKPYALPTRLLGDLE